TGTGAGGVLPIEVLVRLGPGRRQVFGAHRTGVIGSDVRTAHGRKVGECPHALVLDGRRRSIDGIAVGCPVGRHLPEVVIEGAVLLDHDHDVIHGADIGSARSWGRSWRWSRGRRRGWAAGKTTTADE